MFKELEEALKRVEAKFAALFEGSNFDDREHAKDLRKVLDAAQAHVELHKAHVELHKALVDTPSAVVSIPADAPAVLPTLMVTPIPPVPVMEASAPVVEAPEASPEVQSPVPAATEQQPGPAPETAPEAAPEAPAA